jgi:hypothetical protein
MLLGTPAWLMRWAVAERPWYPVVRFFSHPLRAGATYTVVLLAARVPPPRP